MFFFLAVWFRRKRREAPQYVAFVGLVLGSMVKSVAKNGMDAEV
jgi:hypothetical protein